MNNICTMCKEDKTINGFVDKKTYCRHCDRAICKRYKEKNSEYNKNYKKQHKKEISEYNKNYNLENRGKDTN